jgi:hypothetical protein
LGRLLVQGKNAISRCMSGRASVIGICVTPVYVLLRLRLWYLNAQR